MKSLENFHENSMISMGNFPLPWTRDFEMLRQKNIFEMPKSSDFLSDFCVAEVPRRVTWPTPSWMAPMR